VSASPDSPARAAEWLYRGLWGVLVRWFAVPKHPPDLPARPGVTVERFHPSLAWVRYLKLWFWISLAIVDGALLLAWIALFFINDRVGLALAPVFFVVAVLPELLAYVAIHLRYDSTWYLLSDRSLRIRRGIWTIRETTVTFENVQDVKIHQGPVERLFGIADVIVETAGGGGKKHGSEDGSVPSHTGLIEGVADAARIRNLIMDRVRRSRTAGLGDEAPENRRVERSPGRGWSPEHVAVLREIRDEIAGLSGLG
jgi:membrane protein YdbS with pleckstrin-like domain